MKQKKAQGLSFSMIIIAILCLVILIILSYFIYTRFGSANKVFSTQELKIKNDACRLKGSRADRQGIEYADIDNDGYPDSCDICVGGDNLKDKDLDGMPDACDKYPDKQPRKKEKIADICKHIWDKETERCILKSNKS